uniref:Uncharacterized protein n=1 Tax=Ananas comosus var. bracteatus TaxID=296719 RepID=A0A6V7NPJ2_ANACO|nr:unnamed protein product [Ananas comosus var. bracteatus]
MPIRLESAAVGTRELDDDDADAEDVVVGVDGGGGAEAGPEREGQGGRLGGRRAERRDRRGCEAPGPEKRRGGDIGVAEEGEEQQRIVGVSGVRVLDGRHQPLLLPPPQLLSADELFADGVLLPLHLLHPNPSPNPKAPQPQPQPQPDKLGPADIAAPPSSGSKRWRDIFRVAARRGPTTRSAAATAKPAAPPPPPPRSGSTYGPSRGAAPPGTAPPPPRAPAPRLPLRPRRAARRAARRARAATRAASRRRPRRRGRRGAGPRAPGAPVGSTSAGRARSGKYAAPGRVPSRGIRSPPAVGAPAPGPGRGAGAEAEREHVHRVPKPRELPRRCRG